MLPLPLVSQDVCIHLAMAYSYARPVPRLYYEILDIDAFALRLVLAEKSVPVVLCDIARVPVPQPLSSLCPSGARLVLADRCLVLYDSSVIFEYIEERYPAPPLLPQSTVDRARIRLYLYRLRADLVSCVRKMSSDQGPMREHHSQLLVAHLEALAPLVAQNPYFLSREFTVADCLFWAVLWRVDLVSLALSAEARKTLDGYRDRLFDRAGVRGALRESDQVLSSAIA